MVHGLRAPVRGRSPHGERGLKCVLDDVAGEWLAGRSPHGERGLKFDKGVRGNGSGSRSPHGERGLKCGLQRQPQEDVTVALLMESVD